MYDITEGVLQTVAGRIESLLLEQQEGIAFAHKKIPSGFKITIGIDMDQTSEGVAVEYALAYPLEPKPEAQVKEKVKKREVINEDQGDLF